LSLRCGYLANPDQQRRVLHAEVDIVWSNSQGFTPGKNRLRLLSQRFGPLRPLDCRSQLTTTINHFVNSHK
jgi:hypothetical protein